MDTPDQSWRRLARTTSNYQVALFLGAGTSLANNVPSWWDFTRQLGKWPDVETFSSAAKHLELTALCEHAQRRSGEAWTEDVRKAIYGGFFRQVRRRASDIPGLSLTDFGSEADEAVTRARRFFEQTNPVLSQLIQLCGRSTARGGFKPSGRVGAVLTTNLDGLIQLGDRAFHKRRVLRTIERSTAESDTDKVSLYHLHGYLLPRRKPESEASDRLVLTEAEYLKRNDDPYHWASVVMHWAMREFPVVFVGSSLTDELIRRALSRTYRERRADHQTNSPDEDRRHFAVTKYEPRNQTLNQVRNDSLAALGVWPLWVKDFRKDLESRIEHLKAGDRG